MPTCPFFCKNGVSYKRNTPLLPSEKTPFADPSYVLSIHRPDYYDKITCPICHGTGTISDEDYALYDSGMRGGGTITYPDTELGKLQVQFRKDFVTKGFINKEIAQTLLDNYDRDQWV
jgi:hypothetical protein